MVEITLINEVAAAANSAPHLLRLAQIGFDGVRRAKEQLVMGEMDIDRAARRSIRNARVVVATPSEASALFRGAS